MTLAICKFRLQCAHIELAQLFAGETADAILIHGGDGDLSRGKVSAIPVRALAPRLREIEAALR